MIGARIRIDLVGIDDAERRLGALVATDRNLTPLVADIGEYLVCTTTLRTGSMSRCPG